MKFLNGSISNLNQKFNKSMDTLLAKFRNVSQTLQKYTLMSISSSERAGGIAHFISFSSSQIVLNIELTAI